MGCKIQPQHQSLHSVVSLYEIYCSKLYDTNCWATQTAFVANGDPYDAKSAEGMKKLMNFLWVKTPIGRWLS